MKNLITSLLVAALLLSFPSGQKARANPNPEWAMAGCAVVVLVVGVVIVVSLANFCKHHLPPLDPPPPPPQNPTNNVSTNNVGHESVEVSQPLLPQLILTNDICRDISAYGYMDASNAEYTAMFACSIESSANLQSWRPDCTVTGWVSDMTVVTEIYSNGIPQSTNWLVNWQQQATNNVNLPFVPDMTSARKFFRLSCATNY